MIPQELQLSVCTTVLSCSLKTSVVFKETSTFYVALLTLHVLNVHGEAQRQFVTEI